jgi:methyl-accepting chemotaxis protein
MNSVDQQAANANRNLDRMVASMQAINESSGHLAHLIDLIDEIAFQTSILALAPAVETARSGEAGRGLPAVAAASEVKTLIDEVSVGSQAQPPGIGKITRAVMQTHYVTQTAAATAVDTARAGEQFKTIAEAMRNVVSQLGVLPQRGSVSHQRLDVRPQTNSVG